MENSENLQEMLKDSWFYDHWTRLDEFNIAVDTCIEKHTSMNIIVSFHPNIEITILYEQILTEGSC